MALGNFTRAPLAIFAAIVFLFILNISASTLVLARDGATPRNVSQANDPSNREPIPGAIVIAQSDVTEKEAFEAAKDLGTIEAWEAFLENFPKGFRADLARAYVKRIGTDGADTAAAEPEQPPQAAPAPPAPADISLAMTSVGACTGGRNCSVTVTATNAGGEPFSGDLTIATSLAPGGAELQGTGTPPFSCEGVGGGAICSTGLANIAPGQSIAIPMTFTLPRNAGGQVTTCASIAWGGVPSALGAREVQRKLNELGFAAGPADGQPGRQTVNAIKEFQKSSGIQETGEIDLPLLLALFAPGGPGDADPVNDQACAGAAVTQAPPLPAAFQPPAGPTCPLGQIVASNGTCGCPSSVPVWTGTSCIPRLARNCKGGTYYNKGQKLCLCPSSKPHWYNNRCHAQFDNCPGDSTRVGDKCLKENDPGFAARPRPNRSQFGGGCSGNAIRIGNVCVNIANAPVFGGRPGRGGGQTFTGGGNRPNRPQGGGQTATQQGRALKCPAGEVASLWGCVKGPVPNCPPGVLHQVTADRRVLCDTAQAPQPNPNPPPPPPIVKGAPPPPPPIVKGGGQPPAPKVVFNCIGGQSTGSGCNCPPGQTAQLLSSRLDPAGNRTRIFRCQGQQAVPPTPPATGVQCGPGMQPQGNTCVSAKPQGGVTKQILCPSNLVPQNGKCGCAPGLTWNGQVCAAPQQKRAAPPPPKQPAQPAQRQCPNGMVQLASGQCGCPGGQIFRDGRCKNPSTTDKFKQMLKQQQNQQPQGGGQQQGLSPQQQQNINNAIKNFLSDARLKRDIEHVATQADGLKLYVFRYLWDETVYVGVLAQDLLADPARAQAVSLHESGYYMVDYGKLGLEMVALKEWRAASP